MFLTIYGVEKSQCDHSKYIFQFNRIRKKSGNITSKISDHMPVFIILEKLELRTTKAIKRRGLTKFDPQKFIVDIKRLHLSNTLKQHNNANQSYDVFHDLFVKIINNHAPVKTLSKKEIKMQKKAVDLKRNSKVNYKKEQV